MVRLPFREIGIAGVCALVACSMPTGIMLYPSPNAVNVVDDVVSQARRAHQVGVRQVWVAQ
jgi:hypothetical protein